MTVKQKLISFAFIISIALLGLGVFYYIVTNSVQDKLETAVDLSKKAVASSDGVEQTIINSQEELNTMSERLSSVTEPLQLNKQRLSILARKSENISIRINDLRELLQNATALLSEDDDLLYELEDAIYELEDIQSELKRELQANIEITSQANNNAADDVIEGANELNHLNLEFQNAFESLVAINAANTQNNQTAISIIEATKDKNLQSKMLLTVTIFVIASLVIGIVLYIIFLVTRPLTILQNGIAKLGKGDFTTQFEVIRDDEFGDLSKAMNNTVVNIKNTLTEIQKESRVLLETAGNMEQNSKNTKVAVQKEQDEVTSVVCATQQMLQAAGSVTKASNESLLSSQASSDASAKGVEIVKENIRKVNLLAEEFNQAASVVTNVQVHTEEIYKILEVIKDITEQTNLLALNAAIEAARAGEQGRGFAVVADEVRQLALRTQNSTTQITDIIQGLINSSQNAVNHMKNSEKGVLETSQEAEKINSVFEVISEKVADIKARIDTVASASEEQSQVSQLVQKRMESIEFGTKNVHRMADDVVDKSSSLKELSQRIASQLNQFTI